MCLKIIFSGNSQNILEAYSELCHTTKIIWQGSDYTLGNRSKQNSSSSTAAQNLQKYLKWRALK